MKTRIIQTTPDEPPRPPDRPRTNLAGRMGRWSAHHRKTAIFGWLGFVVVAFVVGNMVGATKIDNNTSGVGESGRADRILDAGFKQPAGETVLIQSETRRCKRSCVPGRRRRCRREGVGVRLRRRTFARRPSPATRVRSRRTGARRSSTSTSRATRSTRRSKINPVVDAVADIQKANPQFFVGEFGDASTDKQIEGAFLDDLAKAGMLSLPVTLIILVVVFGSLVAAGIPLLLALTAIFATFGLIAIPSSLVPIDETVYELILLIGLAVGVDYSMFYLKREREERAARPQRGGGARGCRSHVRPLGADLGADRDHRDGRHVLRRDSGDDGVRPRDDHGGRSRHVRLTDGSARRPRVARRSGRQGSCAVRRPPSPRRQRWPHLGRDHRQGASATAGLDRALRRTARRSRAAGASAPHREREPGDVPGETCPSSRPTSSSRSPSPGTGSPPPSSSRPRTSDRRRPRARSPTSSGVRWRAIS